MSRKKCGVVFVRDDLIVKMLKKKFIWVYCVGNLMMDGVKLKSFMELMFGNKVWMLEMYD